MVVEGGLGVAANVVRNAQNRGTRLATLLFRIQTAPGSPEMKHFWVILLTGRLEGILKVCKLIWFELEIRFDRSESVRGKANCRG